MPGTSRVLNKQNKPTKKNKPAPHLPHHVPDVPTGWQQLAVGQHHTRLLLLQAPEVKHTLQQQPRRTWEGEAQQHASVCQPGLKGEGGAQMQELCQPRANGTAHMLPGGGGGVWLLLSHRLMVRCCRPTAASPPTHTARTLTPPFASPTCMLLGSPPPKHTQTTLHPPPPPVCC